MTKMPRLRRPLTSAFGFAAAVLLTSCAQSGAEPEPSTSPSATSSTSPSSASSTSPSSAPSPAPTTSAGRRIEVIVTGKQVKPEPATVNIAVGESLTIAVTSDKDNTLHAHGFEIAKKLKAGELGEVTIKGARSGVFEFELHDPELRLFQVAVR